VNQVKDGAVGDDSVTNNIISFIVSIGLALLVAGGLLYFGAGVLSLIAGGVVCVLSMFMFAQMGWLSPFILIGLIIVLILLVFFGIIMRG